MKPLDSKELPADQPKPETQAGQEVKPATAPRPRPSGKGINPGLRLRTIEAAAQRANPPKIPRRSWLSFQREKVAPAYWNVTSSLSLIINAILIAVVLLMSREIFSLKRMLVRDLLGGLAYNFSLMDQARIKADVPVNLEVPLNLQIPINLATDVTITRDTPIDNAPIKIFAGIITINGPADIVIPAGTVLPIQLNMTVPYQQILKYSTSVTVDIPLVDTSLHTPFVNLQEVVSPYFWAFAGSPFYWEDIAICKPLRAICAWWFK
ncbi:hypothetical protein GW866_03970 [bacterium]|nr:hypothetical protein [bacterium]OIO90755.1 MAG: hypothetical protein AUK02_00745 [Anaerolineae bacterium CG2_30_58_95]PIU89980.1 MAG: hypothetical protein COS63_04285 [Anaerolineae bacterium CG06_land_8_20_14_3_00_57_67]PIW20465.1 MAG: hypothetical protein COW33_02205 [Anaerolineae bacterium CG17_big_fil_post_rev_8_21_14_2_50_57_27]PIZ25094.1 MAG: hypothetical protein COY47_07880 [Chloroflexi bacterium CG_4_10_14_0_8_um_filter_57_5]